MRSMIRKVSAFWVFAIIAAHTPLLTAEAAHIRKVPGRLGCRELLSVRRVLGRSATELLHAKAPGYSQAWATPELTHKMALWFAEKLRWQFNAVIGAWDLTYAISAASLEPQFHAIAQIVKVGAWIADRDGVLWLDLKGGGGGTAAFQAIKIGTVTEGITPSNEAEAALRSIAILTPGVDVAEYWPETDPFKEAVQGRRCRIKLSSGEIIIDIIKSIEGPFQYDDCRYVSISSGRTFCAGHIWEREGILSLRCEPAQAGDAHE